MVLHVHIFTHQYWTKVEAEKMFFTEECISDAQVSCLSYLALALSYCGPWPDSTRPYGLEDPTSHVPNKVRFDKVETDSLERLFGNLRRNLTGGHGDVYQVLNALSKAAMGSFDLVNTAFYKTNCEANESNAVSMMLTNIFDEPQ